MNTSELERKSANGYFARMWRAAACTGANDPRFPSIVRLPTGDLLLSFTHTPVGSKTGAIALSRSMDGGKCWSDPVDVFVSESGTPRALGTMSFLSTGTLLLPFADGVRVRMLVSGDTGATWVPAEAIDCSPLSGATPYGRIVEVGSELLMPMYGRMSVDGRSAPCSGVLRSTDDGRTWGSFTVIACDGENGSTEYGPVSVCAGGSGVLLAMVSVAEQYLSRSVSTDGGRTWSKPEQRLYACNPCLIPVGPTIACVNRGTAPSDATGVTFKGVFRVQFSDDLFDTWRCDRMLDQAIKGDHCSATALDGDRLLIVHDRIGYPFENRGTQVTAGINVGLMQRNPQAPSVGSAPLPATKRDNWEPVETFTTELQNGFGELVLFGEDLYTMSGGDVYVSSDTGRTFRKAAIGPTTEGFHGYSGAVLRITKSGRWLLFNYGWIFEHGVEDWDGVRETYIGDDGYLHTKQTGIKGRNAVRVYSSDDLGSSWSDPVPMGSGPLVWMHPYGRMIEEEDGILSLSVYGCYSDEDTARRSDCCGLIRSRDGGESWGDFSETAYDEAGHEIAYNEMDFLPLADGAWLAVARTEWRSHHAGEASSSSVCFSPDRGRSWSRPEFAFVGAVPDLCHLPDGGVVCATSGSKIRFTYDGGHTWSREMPVHAESKSSSYPGVEVIGEDRMLVYSKWAGRDAALYRRRKAR